jgi:hypothetical protein
MKIGVQANRLSRGEAEFRGDIGRIIKDVGKSKRLSRIEKALGSVR